MTALLYCDLETFSETPITHGTYAYSEKAEVLIWAFAFDDGPVQIWDCTETTEMPYELAQGLDDPEVTTVWHNGGMFDLVILREAMGIDIPLNRVWDTMIQALSHSLPGKLSELSEVLGMPSNLAKDKAGKQLIQLFCKPRPKTAKIQRATRLTHPAEWAQFLSYAGSDILAMREVYRLAPKWNMGADQRELWAVDQTINRRGICVDLDLAKSALAAVDAEKLVLAERTVDMTSGEVQTTTQRNAMLEHMLTEYGVALPDLTMATVEKAINDDDIPAGMKALLRVRLQAGTTSTAKYQALMRAVSRDGRLHNTMQFRGASRTGRFAHRLFQPGNMPRPTMKNDAIEQGIEALKAGVAGLIYPNVMELSANAIRGCIVAPKGKKLVVADLSNIEGRGIAWLAGEEWKLQAFRDFDAGIGFDLYKLAYAKAFGIDPASVTKDQRQVGKVMELALAYASGVNGFATFATVYGIDLDDLASKVLPVADPELVAAATSFLAWRRKQDPKFSPGMSDNAFISCDVVKRGWRNGHPAISAWWPMLEQAFRDAIDSPGFVFDCGTVKIRRDGSWIRARLPSGRFVCYPSPAIDDKGRCSYMGVDQYSRRWSRIQTYSGKLAENFCQSFAADILTYNMPAIEAEGYLLTLSVHDELICECPDTNEFTHGRLAALMSTVPPWAEGLPLAAAGFECYRYRKE